MQPADSLLPEDLVPVKIPWLELAGRGVAAIRNPHGTPHPETSFREIEPHSGGSTNPVKRRPLNETGIDAALQDEILRQAPDIIVGECRAHRRAQAKTAAQPARHIVLPAALPDPELARAANPAFTRVQAQHDFAQGDQVILAFGGESPRRSTFWRQAPSCSCRIWWQRIWWRSSRPAVCREGWRRLWRPAPWLCRHEF